MATIDVKDATGATVAVEKPLAPGRAAAASSRPVALSTEDKTKLDDLVAAVQDTTTPSPVKLAGQGEYETVAASASDQVLGSTGAIGDYLSHLLVIPATTSPGFVKIKDGAGSLITVFAGGASSVSNLVPFCIPVAAFATGAGWKVTTDTNVSVFAVGDFT